jgi:hypothetical protein
VVEFNASDTRSKKSLQEHVAQMTGNKSMHQYFGHEGAAAPSAASSRPTALIMDEVDGMSSGDRGGIAELILLIKHTQVCILLLLLLFCFPAVPHRGTSDPDNMYLQRSAPPEGSLPGKLLRGLSLP